MIKEVATIILNRNLPKVTDKLYNHIKKYDGKDTDIFILESGSENNNLSKNYTWHAKSKSIKKKGLRFFRGMNYALKKLYLEKRFYKYKYFFLISNDTELEKKRTIKTLKSIAKKYKKIGMVVPCSKKWGEKKLLKKNKEKFVWYVDGNAFFLKNELISKLCNYEENYKKFFFDGDNFRGYGLTSEIIAKSYANDFATMITSRVFIEENESYLINKSNLIQTDDYHENIKLYYQEGQKWMKKKYGFNNKWQMQNYVKLFYDQFFLFNPDLKNLKI